MTNTNMKGIMQRAHQIARSCEGNCQVRLALVLRQAWAEHRLMEIGSRWQAPRPVRYRQSLVRPDYRTVRGQRPRRGAGRHRHREHPGRRPGRITKEEDGTMTKPKLSKTHRWDPDLFDDVEDLARRTGRPVQHILDDAVAIGLERIEDAIDGRMREMTAGEAWEAYVGSQSPAEFWEISRDQGATTYAEAAERYALDLPSIFRTEWADMEAGDYPDLDRLSALLAEHLEDNLGPLPEEN